MRRHGARLQRPSPDFNRPAGAAFRVCQIPQSIVHPAGLMPGKGRIAALGNVLAFIDHQRGFERLQRSPYFS